MSVELPKISEPPTSESLRKRVLLQLALAAVAGNGKPPPEEKRT